MKSRVLFLLLTLCTWVCSPSTLSGVNWRPSSRLLKCAAGACADDCMSTVVTLASMPSTGCGSARKVSVSNSAWSIQALAPWPLWGR
eukprot:4727245-Amphidinium_carterae.1